MKLQTYRQIRAQLIRAGIIEKQMDSLIEITDIRMALKDSINLNHIHKDVLQDSIISYKDQTIKMLSDREKKPSAWAIVAIGEFLLLLLSIR